MTGEETAGEVAGGVGQHRRDQDPVESGRPVQQVVLERCAEHERGDGERRRERELDRGRHPQVLRSRHAARVAVGDGARQQLVHGPVEHRDRDEDGRPQQRHLAVLLLGERVAREREVRERDQPRGADPHRQDRGAPAIASTRRGAPRSSHLVHSHQEHRPRNGERTCSTVPWRASRVANERWDQWFT